MLVTYFGIFKAGMIAHPLNARLKPRELSGILAHADSKLIVAAGEHLQSLSGVQLQNKRLPPVLCFDAPSDSDMPLMSLTPLAKQSVSRPSATHSRNDDDALLIYTSGTTSDPKGVRLTHANMAADANAIATALAIGPTHRTLCFMPLSHCNALVFSHLSCFLVGATVVLTARFSASDHWRLVRDNRVNSFSCPPTVLAILLERQLDELHSQSSLDYIKVGSAPLPQDLAERFEARFGQLLLEGYGLTEATCTNTLNPVAGPRKRGSVGQALPGHELQVINEDGNVAPSNVVGELVVRGPTVMKGYFRDPEATENTIVDGWLRTGDLAQIDSDGYVSVVGRKKEMLVRGGENVSPLEIEEVLRRHPLVRDAAVIGVPDPIWGEVVAAFVISDESLVPAEVVEFCRPLLADFKLPQHIFQVDELPRNETGKIQRQRLKEMHRQFREDGHER